MNQALSRLSARTGRLRSPDTTHLIGAVSTAAIGSTQQIGRGGVRCGLPYPRTCSKPSVAVQVLRPPESAESEDTLRASARKEWRCARSIPTP